MTRGTNLELFSCSGGMAEGFRRAGITFDHVFDHDADACASYERNLGHAPVRMDVHDLLRFVRAGWRPGGHVELLVADPPCTPWSRAGKRLGLEDERDMLRETAELVALLRPRTYLIGNVLGLRDASSWGRLSGHVTVGTEDPSPTITRKSVYALVRSSDGHPPATPEEPSPTIRGGGAGHSAPQVVLADSRKVGRWPGGNHLPSRADEPALTVCANGPSSASGVLVLNHKHPINAPDLPSRTVCAKDRGGAQGARAMSWPWDVPSTTVCADDRQPPPGRNGRRRGESQRGHPNAVVLSERAATILQGFPETWVFVGRTKRSRWAQLGMAMPPPLAEAVARAVAARRG